MSCICGKACFGWFDEFEGVPIETQRLHEALRRLPVEQPSALTGRDDVAAALRPVA